MTAERTFDSTQLLISSGFVFVNDLDENGLLEVGFMRRLQPEIHHGPQMPLTMATVGGMFQPLMNAEENGAVNAEGFVGRPMTLFENAQKHALSKLSIWMESSQGRKPSWDVIDHPYYYGEKTPNVRNVGKVMRQVYSVDRAGRLALRNGLAIINDAKPADQQSELVWMDVDAFENALGGNHSLKAGEIDYLRELYGLLDSGYRPSLANFILNL